MNPRKAHQIGFFASAVAGVFHFLSIILFINITLGLGNTILVGELKILDVIFPVLLVFAWESGRKLGTQVLIDDLPVYKTAYWSMVSLATLSVIGSSLITAVYQIIISLVEGNSSEFYFSFITIIEYFFGMIFAIVLIFVLNLLPTLISAKILSVILNIYKK